ncbi:ankyrin repeat domain 34Bb [Callorhinchus milii]|uniref:Ankyrin repeat domain 34Ba n=1 Tax=Callorhinchus milii TaxID=7868 RepID=A0A4W3HR29_CALMI|nr:ankyrin repeat domain 34Bb [Callorhinchus milii]|eukprot:gi/632963577/ref/XP_007897962.1/ PREDICTED: ankyrin repeat domain-containing protein 34B [Callorhinchus milii]
MEVRTDGNSLLKAVYLSRLRLTRLLLEGGAYINESNERGETPLMIACRTKHTDHQSVSKVKMVKYLLENHADPNIQDKSGRTALMHACTEQAGAEVVSLLLKSNADPSLEDHSGCSALVCAVNSGDKETLRILLDACKARGKEVIIITTAKSPSGRQTTKQYLNVPPPPHIDDRHSPIPCTSPSDIELKTSPPHLNSNVAEEKRVFSFREPVHLFNNQGSSEPASPTRKCNQTHSGAKFPQLQRLHSEPWLNIPPSLVPQNKISSFQEETQNLTPEESLSLKINGLILPKRLFTRHQSIDVKDTAGLLRALDQASALAGPRKLSYDEMHSQSAQPGSQRNSTLPVDQDPDHLQLINASSLRNIVHRRNLGINHYSSDSQLTTCSMSTSLDETKTFLEKKKMITSPLAASTGSRDSLDNLTTIRKQPGILERRGSGTLLSDRISQTRPGYLPPLNINPHPPIPDIRAISKDPGPFPGGGKPLLPAAPNSQKRTDVKSKKMLLRRHSVQAEQMKQLANFEEIFGQ